MAATRSLLVAAATTAALAGRYAAGRDRAGKQTVKELGTRLADLGEVERLSVLPLVERHTLHEGLRGEPGVSHLIRADGLTLLFDTGAGHRCGPDRVGVQRGLSRRVAERPRLRGDLAPACRPCRWPEVAVPEHVQLRLRTSRTCWGDRFRAHRNESSARRRLGGRPGPVIGPGVALLPPLPRMLFWLGPIAEQALVVNVRGLGLVVISGCGHPEIERTLAAAEQVVDAPVHGVLGGLHLPVHPMGTPLLPQAVLGNPNWPWRPINEDDARSVIRSIGERWTGHGGLAAVHFYATPTDQLH
jgi:7,8-dihydropterin-6-yl-methyl-4-(beta-D-ribofuranosyl)aminobenzene 5'-phosphate synthase